MRDLRRHGSDPITDCVITMPVRDAVQFARQLERLGRRLCAQ